MDKHTGKAGSNAGQAARATLTINGKLYDVHSGKSVDPVTRTSLPKTRQYGGFDIRPATGVHSGPSRSQTLRRTGLAKPASANAAISRHGRAIISAGTPAAKPSQAHPLVSRFGRTNDLHAVAPIKRSSSINTVTAADQPVAAATKVQHYTPGADIARPAHKPPVSASKALTTKAVDEAPTHKQKAVAHKAKKKADARVESSWKRFKKHIRPNPPLVITGAAVLLVIIGAVAYLTVPALSLFVAAKSAGVDATYPNYVPSGYSFKGPVTYKDGDVSMHFTANGSGASFTIDQRTSFWDSGAVLDNYVLARTQDYLTYSQEGITVYTFGSSAAWMNAGVLHTIDGNAPLTSDEILRIAGSM